MGRSLIPGFEEFIEDTPLVTPAEYDTDTTEQEDQESVFETTNEVTEKTAELKMMMFKFNLAVTEFGRMYTLCSHIRQNGISKEFMQLFNTNHSLERMCKVSVPSMESFSYQGPDTKFSIASCEGFKEVITKIIEHLKKFAAKIWEKIKSIGATIKNFFKKIFGSSKENKQKLEETAPIDMDPEEAAKKGFKYADNPVDPQGKSFLRRAGTKIIEKVTFQDARKRRSDLIKDIEKYKSEINDMIRLMRDMNNKINNSVPTVIGDITKYGDAVMKGFQDADKLINFKGQNKNTSNVEMYGKRIADKLGETKEIVAKLESSKEQFRTIVSTIYCLFKNELEPFVKDVDDLTKSSEKSLNTMLNGLNQSKNMLDNIAARLETLARKNKDESARSHEFVSIAQKYTGQLQDVINSYLTIVAVLIGTLSQLNSAMTRRINANRPLRHYLGFEK